MSDILNIGKVIKYLIENDEDAMGALGANSVWPLVANEATAYPFVGYARKSVQLAGSKDGPQYSSIAYVDVAVLSDNYQAGLSIASLVRKALEDKCGSICGFEVEEIRLEDAIEGFEDDVFIQQLTYKIEIES